jgi:hypothetical protein
MMQALPINCTTTSDAFLSLPYFSYKRKEKIVGLAFRIEDFFDASADAGLAPAKLAL